MVFIKNIDCNRKKSKNYPSFILEELYNDKELCEYMILIDPKWKKKYNSKKVLCEFLDAQNYVEKINNDLKREEIKEIYDNNNENRDIEDNNENRDIEDEKQNIKIILNPKYLKRFRIYSKIRKML